MLLHVGLWICLDEIQEGAVITNLWLVGEGQHSPAGYEHGFDLAELR